MDVIALAQAGIENAVAPLGTALTENQLELLWRMAGEPVLCFDGDQAGLRAAWRAADLALPLIGPGRTLRFAILPEGQDPDDIVRSSGAVAFNEVLADARPLADLLWSRETSGAVLDTPERRAELEGRLRELVSRIRDENVRRHYQQEMRERANAFFGAARGNGRPRDTNRPGAPRTGIAAGRLAVSESLARSALVRSSGGVMPLRETALVMTLLNHPMPLDEYFDTSSVSTCSIPSWRGCTHCWSMPSRTTRRATATPCARASPPRGLPRAMTARPCCCAGRGCGPRSRMRPSTMRATHSSRRSTCTAPPTLYIRSSGRPRRRSRPTQPKRTTCTSSKFRPSFAMYRQPRR